MIGVTVTCRQVCSQPESFWRRETLGRVLVFAMLALIALLAPRAHAIEGLRLAIADITHPALSVHDVQLEFSGTRSTLELHIAHLRLGDRSWRKLHLSCPQASLSAQGVRCRGAALRVGGHGLPLVLDFQTDLAGSVVAVELRLSSGAQVSLSLDDEGRFEAGLARFGVEDLAMLASLLSPQGAPDALRYLTRGQVDARLVWEGASAGRAHDSLMFMAQLSEAAFSTVDGLRAGEGLGVGVDVSARATSAGWDWQAQVAWEHGEAYLHPLYLQAGPVLNAAGAFHAEQIEIHNATLELEGVAQLAFAARIERAGLTLEDFALSLAGGDLAILGPRWIAPLLAPALGERLRFAGHVGASLEVEEGRVLAFDVVFDAAEMSLAAADGGRGFGFGPLTGHLPWLAGSSTRAQLQVQGGYWEALALGAFDVDAMLKGQQARFESMRIPLLDGMLVLDEVELRRESQDWLGRGSVVMEPVSMRLLTQALGLPSMGGLLSASLPGVRVSPGEITFDGAVVMSVFDGYVQATQLHVREPFGVASHARADIEARHLDLAQLTDTFSFGSITGFVDADVHGLELVRWRPTSFDARLLSSPGDYRRRISQRAVQNISALGGAGAMAVLQRGVLGLFDTFGYRELGFQCVLAGGVCLMSGIDGGERADGSFQIVRGGGIPALDVIGYNRRVDWNELVGRIQRVIDENVTPELH